LGFVVSPICRDEAAPDRGHPAKVGRPAIEIDTIL
jgi:hypothetical protein